MEMWPNKDKISNQASFIPSGLPIRGTFLKKIMQSHFSFERYGQNGAEWPKEAKKILAKRYFARLYYLDRKKNGTLLKRFVFICTYISNELS